MSNDSENAESQSSLELFFESAYADGALTVSGKTSSPNSKYFEPKATLIWAHNENEVEFIFPSSTKSLSELVKATRHTADRMLNSITSAYTLKKYFLNNHQQAIELQNFAQNTNVDNRIFLTYASIIVSFPKLKTQDAKDLASSDWFQLGTEKFIFSPLSLFNTYMTSSDFKYTAQLVRLFSANDPSMTINKMSPMVGKDLYRESFNEKAISAFDKSPLLETINNIRLITRGEDFRSWIKTLNRDEIFILSELRLGDKNLTIKRLKKILAFIKEYREDRNHSFAVIRKISSSAGLSNGFVVKELINYVLDYANEDQMAFEAQKNYGRKSFLIDVYSRTDIDKSYERCVDVWLIRKMATVIGYKSAVNLYSTLVTSKASIDFKIDYVLDMKESDPPFEWAAILAGEI